MRSDLSMALNGEIHRMQNKEKGHAKPKNSFPSPTKMEKKVLPSEEVQGAVQTVLQQALSGLKPSFSAIVTAPTLASSATQIALLFKEMVGGLCRCHEAGVQTTTLSLNAPQFAHSPFYGAKITITEYSTAPTLYNVELAGSPEAISLCQGGAADLMAAFQQGEFKFGVHRIDTALMEPRAFQRGKVSPPSDKGPTS